MNYRRGLFLWMALFVIVPLVIIQYESGAGKLLLLAEVVCQLVIAWFFSKKLYRSFSLPQAIKQQLETGLQNNSVIGIESVSSNRVNTLSSAVKALELMIDKYSRDWAKLYEDVMVYKDRILTLEKSHKTLEKKLQLQNRINEKTGDMLLQPVLLLDDTGIILDVNSAFANRIGKNREGLFGKPLSDYTYDANQISSNGTPLAFKVGAPGQIEYITFHTHRLDDGTWLCTGKFLNDDLMIQSQILRKNREIEYINQINSSLISNWSVDELLENIIKRIDYLFNIQAGVIYISMPDKTWRLKTFASKHLSKEDVEALNIPSYFSESWLNTPEIQMTQVEDDNMRAIVLAPLEISGEVIAVMSIALIQRMSENDINILRMFTNQASVVVQRALIYDQLRKQYLNTIEALVNVIEAKDKYTEGHSRRVSRFAVEIAKEMGYSNEEIEDVEIAGLLHDIGKIGIRQDILTKRGKLTDEEYEIMKQHPEKGFHILEAINLNPKIKESVLYHHLRYDLKGYPKCSAERLPVYASIIGIADAFDAITSARSYSQARSIEDALKELNRFSGTQFDPKLVLVFETIAENHREILQRIIDDEVSNLIAEGEFNVLSSFV